MPGKRGSSRKKRGSGSNPWVLLLYPLTAAGGVYGGVQAYNAYQALPPAPGSAAPQSHVAAAHNASARREGNRERSHSRSVRDSGDEVVSVRAERTKRSREPEKPEAQPPANPLADAALPTTAAGDPGAQPTPSPARSVTPSGEPATRPIEEHPVTPPGTSHPAAAIPHVASPGGPATPVPPVEIARGAGQRREVALTFDAGSDWKPVKKILSALAEEGVKSTFFLTGEWVQKNPKTTVLIANGGHELGNHSWNHPPFTHLSADEIRSQLRRTDSIIQETAGRSSRPYFRPPLGDRNLRVRQVVGGEGFFTVYWTLDSRDSVDKGITAEQIRDRVLSKVGAGSIVLMHCGSQPTADALPEILKGLHQKGLTPVTISQLLEE